MAITTVGGFRSDEAGARYAAALAAAMAELPPHVSRDVSTSYGTVRGHRFGSAEGTPLLLIPGRIGTTARWAPNLPALAARHTEWALDLLGEPGASVQTVPIAGDADQAAWLAEVVDALGGPVHVVGASLAVGGAPSSLTPPGGGALARAARAGAHAHAPAARFRPRLAGLAGRGPAAVRALRRRGRAARRRPARPGDGARDAVLPDGPRPAQPPLGRRAAFADDAGAGAARRAQHGAAGRPGRRPRPGRDPRRRGRGVARRRHALPSSHAGPVGARLEAFHARVDAA